MTKQEKTLTIYEATSKLINKDSVVPSPSGTPARAVNPNNKDWTKMDRSERQANWSDIVKGYAMRK